MSTDGTWGLELEPQEACISATLTITISRDQQKTNEEMITLNNVAFGDVFFCSGQSNMLLTVGINEMHSDVVKRYARARPGIMRGYTVVHQLANEPQDTFEQHETWFEQFFAWTVALPLQSCLQWISSTSILQESRR